MRNLQRPTISGGIKYPNPIVYTNLFYISNLFEYFKTRKNDLPINSNTYLIEYEIGLALSQIYNLRKLNHLPHRNKLTPFYQQSLGILAQYKITLKELTTRKNKPNIPTIIQFRLHPVKSRQIQMKINFTKHFT